MKMRVTMMLPGETEAGSAGMQPCRGIAWRAHRDDGQERGSSSFALFPKHIGSVDPDALKIPARRAEYSLTDNASPPVHAEPAHFAVVFVKKCVVLISLPYKHAGVIDQRVRTC